MERKFLLFIGEYYYPNRWDDFKGEFNSKESAWKYAKYIAIRLGSQRADDWWYQVVSTESWKVISEGGLLGLL